MKNKKTTNMVIFSMLLAIEVVMSFIPAWLFADRTAQRDDAAHSGHHLRDGAWQEIRCGARVRHGLLLILQRDLLADDHQLLLHAFLSMGGVEGNWTSLLIAFIPRIALGYGAGAIYERLKSKNGRTAAALSGLSGALINTIGVLGGIWIFFKEPYEAVLGNTIVALLMTTVGVNSIAEAVVGVIAAMAVHTVLKHRNLS